VFDGAVGTRDLVTWNSMLAAYVVHDKDEEAFNLFSLRCKGLGLSETYILIIFLFLLT